MENISNLESYSEDYSISLSACTLTQEIKTPQKLISILNSANYQVIPPLNTKLQVSYDWKFLRDICGNGVTKNKLLDICLPFDFAKGKKKKIELVRVLMLNNTIVGIRVQSHSEDHRRKSKTFKLPSDVKKWCHLDSCQIGQFYLHLSNVKIALIFQSQINTFPNILQEYRSIGCEIFSIVNDVPQKSKQQNELLHSKIKQFNTKYKTVIIYSSLLYAVTLENIYQGRSYINIGGSTLTQSSISMFDQSQSIFTKLKITDIKSSTIQSSVIHTLQTNIPSLTFEYSLIDLSNNIPLKAPAFTKYSPQLDSNLIHIYHTWYLFKNVNERCPFIISTKTNPAILLLINSIYLLSQKLQSINQTKSNYDQNEILKKLLVLYNNNKSNIQQKLMRKIVLQLQQNYIQSNELIEFLINQKYQKICFYTQDATQIKKSKSLASKFKKEQVIIVNDLQKFKVNKKDLLVGESFGRSLAICASYENKDQKIIPQLHKQNIQKQIQNKHVNMIILQSTEPSSIAKQFTKSPTKQIQVQQFKQQTVLIQHSNHTNCHICRKVFDISQNLTLTCQCKNTFCFDCLDLFKLSTFSFDSHCPSCQFKCPCTQCKFKQKMFQNNCHKCGVSLQMILKKKSSSLITVQCSSKRCNIKYCTNCISEFQQLDPLLYKFEVKSFHSWVCYFCRKICNCLLCNFQKKNKEETDLKNRQLFVEKQNVQMCQKKDRNMCYENQRRNQQREKLCSIKLDRNKCFSRQRSRQDKVQSQLTNNNKSMLRRNILSKNRIQSDQNKTKTLISQTHQDQNDYFRSNHNNNSRSDLFQQNVQLDDDQLSDFSFAAHNLHSSPNINYFDFLSEQY